MLGEELRASESHLVGLELQMRPTEYHLMADKVLRLARLHETRSDRRFHTFWTQVLFKLKPFFVVFMQLVQILFV